MVPKITWSADAIDTYNGIITIFKRKHLVIFLLLISCVCATPATAQSWLWARTAICDTAIGHGGSDARGVATDAFGNVFVTGYYDSYSITFDTTTISGRGGMYLVKYDSSGNVVWARCPYGAAIGTSVATDAWGNIYVTGSFGGTTLTVGAYTLTNHSQQNIFLIKYDNAGNVVWANCPVDTGNDYVSYSSSVATDALGNVYIAGLFTNPTITFGITTLTNVDGVDEDMFIAKYDSSGNVVWAKSAGVSGAGVVATALAADAADNVYVCGYYGGGSALTFGSTTFTSGDIFLVKYNASGSVVWAKSAGSSIALNNNINSITADAFGNIYITGNFQDPTITFGAITLTNFSTSPSDYDMFLVKYDTSGDVSWAQTADAISLAYGVTTDAVGSVYIAGNFGPVITFGGTTLSDTVSDLFLVKYNPAGSVEWAKSAMGDGCDPNVVATDLIGNVYVVGDFFLDSLVFGSTTLFNSDTPLTSYSVDMFLAKLSSTLSTPIINPNQQNIVLYPNPNNGQMTVVFPVAGYSNVVVYDCLGRQVYTTTLTGSEKIVALDLSYMPPGVYFLKATGEGKSESMPFVVKK